MKVKEIVKLIKNDGWYLARQKGSHMQTTSQEKGVTIAFHKMSDDLAKGTEASILKQAKIDKF